MQHSPFLPSSLKGKGKSTLAYMQHIFIDQLLINRYVLLKNSVDFPFISSIPPFPFKEWMGECCTCAVNFYISVRQYLKVGLRGPLLIIDMCCIYASVDFPFPFKEGDRNGGVLHICGLLSTLV